MLGQTVLTLTTLASSVIAAPAQLQSRVIPGVEWSVTDFTRVCTSYSTACTYNFTIVPGGYNANTICTIVDTSSDPIHNSLDSLPCNNNSGNPWVISWGYNAGGNSAVMTVLNTSPPVKEDAWFGWNCVSTTTNFENVGPNKVYALGTFTK